MAIEGTNDKLTTTPAITYSECYAPFFFAFLFILKINYKINKKNCKNIW